MGKGATRVAIPRFHDRLPDRAPTVSRGRLGADDGIRTRDPHLGKLGSSARFGLLLARTDVDAPKNRGLTTFLVDMHAPGVEVRPLRQMTGDAEISEVYFEDARLAADAQLGEEGRGWQVATTTLMNERVSIGNALASHGTGPIATALELFRRHRPGDGALRDRVARLWVESELTRMMSLRAAQLGQTGDPGPVGSVGKLFGAEHNLRIHELVIDLLGSEGMLAGDRHRQFLRSRANTIEGGTSEVRTHPGRANPRTPARRPRPAGPPLEGDPPELAQPADELMQGTTCISSRGTPDCGGAEAASALRAPIAGAPRCVAGLPGGSSRGHAAAPTDHR